MHIKAIPGIVPVFVENFKMQPRNAQSQVFLLSVLVSQRALQCVVVIFEAFELQKVFGPLAALTRGGQVGDLDGGGSAANWGAR